MFVVMTIEGLTSEVKIMKSSFVSLDTKLLVRPRSATAKNVVDIKNQLITLMAGPTSLSVTW